VFTILESTHNLWKAHIIKFSNQTSDIAGLHRPAMMYGSYFPPKMFDYYFGVL
jgi:hypothetical protein